MEVGWGWDKIPWPRQLPPTPPRGQDTLAWAAWPPSIEIWQTQIREVIRSF